MAIVLRTRFVCCCLWVIALAISDVYALSQPRTSTPPPPPPTTTTPTRVVDPTQTTTPPPPPPTQQTPPAPPPPPLTRKPPDVQFWVSFAKIVRPGAPLVVSVHVYNATGPITLSLSLLDNEGKELQDSQNFSLTTTNDDIVTVEFYISKSLTRNWQMWVRATGFVNGAKLFDGFQRVSYSDKRLSIFIQTDKLKYQPGQTVKFRAIAMLPDLQISRKRIDVVIKDPHNNRLAHWLGMESEDNSGVVQGQMTLSDYPPQGDWRIEAATDGYSEGVKFEVEEYELPQFELQLDVPGFALVKDAVVKCKVSAKYTFGGPVKGSGSVVLTLTWGYSGVKSVVKEFQLDAEGEAEIQFKEKDFLSLLSTPRLYGSYYTPSLSYRRFNFDASVTDALTDDVMTSETKSLTFYTDPMRLRFLTTSPTSFKPGFPLTVQLEALNRDDTPLDNPQNVTVSFTVTYVLERKSGYARRYYWQPYPTETKTLLTKDVRLDKFGVATLRIPESPGNAESMTILGKVGKVQSSRYMSKFESPGKTYLRLKMIKQTRKKATFEVYSNVNISRLICQVYAKGNLMESSVKSYNVPKQKQLFSVRMTSAMTPMADVIAFFIAADEEVIVDSVPVGVGLEDSKVSINFTSSEAKPGENVLLHVKAKPKSTVFLLGVDKSVLLLGKGNDITRDRILGELSQYNGGNSYFFRGFWWYPSSTRAYQVFQEAGAGIITNSLVPGKNLLDVPKPYRSQYTTTLIPEPTTTPAPQPTRIPGTTSEGPVPVPMIMDMEVMPLAATAIAMEARKVDNAQVTVAPTPQAPTPLDRIRTFFPETWLWTSVTLGTSHCELLNFKAPDTITTWVVSAISVHKKSGLLPAENTAELLVIKRLFIKLDLPYSAVRGEDVCFTAIVFNRHDKPVETTIHLARNETAFENVLIQRDQNSSDVKEIRKSILISNDLGQLKPNSVVSKVFCLSPVTLGDMPVHVYLTTDGPEGDSIRRTIRIEPEGVERSQSYPVLIELSNSLPVSTTVELDVPDTVVSGSLRISVAVVGDILGGVADNLGDLLKMPYGCGEQNMVNFAPNVYLILYLNVTGRLNADILGKAKSFMVKGYQNQLQYQRSDGSFSAFGNRDRSGSLWLTAFVTLCFSQSVSLGSEVITIEPAFISKAVSWMLQYQNQDGSFREPGRVFHRAMQGGSAEGLGLNAYVTITLQQVVNAVGSQMSNTTKVKLTDALGSSVKYLESQLNNTGDDSYSACILAYALTLTGSQKAKEARQQMEKLAVVGAASKYWSWPAATKQTRYSWYRKTDSMSIEMTAYALLALQLAGPVADTIPVFRWLNKQRGPKGGFISTQDTVLGIEALAAMSDLALERNFPPIDVTVTWCSGQENAEQTSSLTIDESNAILLQRLELPLGNSASYPEKIEITASSNTTKRSFALADVVVTYNVDSGTSDQVFSANLTVTNNTARSFVLSACARRQETGNTSQSMVLVEIGVTSGYEVVKKGSTFGKSSRVEYPKGRVVLYYDYLDSEGDCSVVAVKMMGGKAVAHCKPAYVKVYDYYHPDNEFTVSYNVQQFEVCDLEPNYMECSVNK